MTTLLILARTFHFGSGMILVAVVAFRWLVLFPAFAGKNNDAWQKFASFFRCLSRFFIGSVVVLVLSGFAWFWAVAAEMSGASLADALNEETWATVLFQTQFGHVCQWRLGLAAILGIIMVLLARQHWHFRPTPSLLERAAGFIAIALLVSIAGTGHAAAAGGPAFPWRISADALHLFAASIWPAGLLPFALFLRASRGIEDPSALPPILAVVRRFSAISFITVGILIATGIVNAVFLVGNFSALVTTDYGLILCLKLSLLLVMLGIAAWNRYHLLPLLFARTAASDKKSIRPLFHRLQIFVATEFGLAIAIVVVVSLLGITPPPR